VETALLVTSTTF